MPSDNSDQINQDLAQLDRDGFLLIRNALDDDTVLTWREKLDDLYKKEDYDINNSVGNVAFDRLLAVLPDLSRELIGHSSVAPYLRGVLGKQCQLRSFRAHMNPSEYLQEWHMDFYDYWYQEEKAEANKPVNGFCLNTTFYLTDNTPDLGRLRFVKNFCHTAVPDEMREFLGYTTDRDNPFQQWCDAQEHVDLHPMSGDVIVFYSHVPHQGAKTGIEPDGPIRSNIVLHYQQNPMYPGIHFVSNPQFALDQLGYAGTFPFA